MIPMKGIRQLAMAAGLAMATMASVGAAYADGWAHVVGVAYNDVLNVRSGPGTRYPIVGTIVPRARSVYVVECGVVWCEVQADDVDGWVNASFLAWN